MLLLFPSCPLLSSSACASARLPLSAACPADDASAVLASEAGLPATPFWAGGSDELSACPGVCTLASTAAVTCPFACSACDPAAAERQAPAFGLLCSAPLLRLSCACMLPEGAAVTSAWQLVVSSAGPWLPVLAAPGLWLISCKDADGDGAMGTVDFADPNGWVAVLLPSKPKSGIGWRGGGLHEWLPSSSASKSPFSCKHGTRAFHSHNDGSTY